RLAVSLVSRQPIVRRPERRRQAGPGARRHRLQVAAAVRVSEHADEPRPPDLRLGSETGAFIPGFPRKVEDWQFLTDPTIANVDSTLATPQVLEGSGGYLLHAISSGGAEPTGWPKFTEGWISASAAVGDLADDGTSDVVLNTRDGKLFAWSSSGQTC